MGLFLFNLPCADKDDTVESRKYHPSAAHQQGPGGGAGQYKCAYVTFDEWEHGQNVLAAYRGEPCILPRFVHVSVLHLPCADREGQD